MICTLIVLLCAEALLSAALPLAGGPGDLKRESLTAADAQVAEERDERKVGALHTTAGPFEYVRELQNELAYPDGKPRNPEQDPTNIWYILDKGAPAAATNLLLQSFLQKWAWLDGCACMMAAIIIYSARIACLLSGA